MRRGCKAPEVACLGASIDEGPVALGEAHHWLAAAAAARRVLIASLANVAAAPVVLATRATEYSAVEAVQDPQNSPFVGFKIQILLPIC
jgi:hypothetical protein